MKQLQYLFSVSVCVALVLASCAKKDSSGVPGADSSKSPAAQPTSQSTTGSTTATANPNNAAFVATFDGAPVVLSDTNRWSGIVLGGTANDRKTKIQTVNFTVHGTNHSDYLLSIDYMGGKSGSTDNVNAIVNFPGQSFTAKAGGTAHATITKTDRKDDTHILYSGSFDIDLAKIALSDKSIHHLKGTFENIQIITATGILPHP